MFIDCMQSNHSTIKTEQEIKNDIASLGPVVEGKICERFKNGKIDGYRLQRHRDGRNDTRYLPKHSVQKVQAAIDEFSKLEALVDELVIAGESQVLDNKKRTDDSKKKPTKR